MAKVSWILDVDGGHCHSTLQRNIQIAKLQVSPTLVLRNISLMRSVGTDSFHMRWFILWRNGSENEILPIISCRQRGFSNVSVITCDINIFEANATFDRIFSIEMFEVIPLIYQHLTITLRTFDNTMED